MSAYFLAEMSVHAPDVYHAYVKAATPIVQRHGGQYVFRTEAAQTVAGDWMPERLLCIRFPNTQAIEQCFRSPDYIAIKHLREQSTRSRAVIVNQPDDSREASLPLPGEPDRSPADALAIRPFVTDDRQAVIGLWELCGLTMPWNNPVKDMERKLAVQPELFLVGVHGGRIAGSILAGYDGHRGWLNYLAVHPDCRRRGFGRCLVHAAEKRLIALGCPKVNLQVRDTNLGVVSFYTALGYQKDGCVSLGKRLIHDHAQNEQG